MKSVILEVLHLGQIGQLGVENQIQQMLVRLLKIRNQVEELIQIIHNQVEEI
jgi:hypothetical protein